MEQYIQQISTLPTIELIHITHWIDYGTDYYDFMQK